MSERLLTIAEAAREFSVSERTISRKIRAGEIPEEKVQINGRQKLIPYEVLSMVFSDEEAEKPGTRTPPPSRTSQKGDPLLNYQVNATPPELLKMLSSLSQSVRGLTDEVSRMRRERDEAKSQLIPLWQLLSQREVLEIMISIQLRRDRVLQRL